MKKEQGFVEVLLTLALVATGLWFFFWFLPSIRFEPSEQVVSGIAYNTSNDAFISGSTYFSVRAGVDTYVDVKNESSYCLPKGSQYIALVNKAAADKSIKVVVTTKKIFAIVANPFICVDNVTVTQAK